MQRDPGMSNDPSDRDTEPLETAQRLIRQGDFAAAEAMLQPHLARTAPDPEMLYCHAVCQRKLGNHAGALKTIDRLLGVSPDHARACQERAYNHLARGNGAAAGAAFEAALIRNPALLSSWQQLAQLPGYPGAAAAREQAARLKALPPALLAASSLMHQNRLHNAETLCRQFLRQNPSHPEGMRLLAELAQKFHILEEAEFLLESCLQFAPDYTPARHDFVAVLQRRQKFDLALREARFLARKDPASIPYTVGLGNALQAAGDFDGAVDAYSRALAAHPDLHAVHVAKGHALKTIGRTPAAIESYRAAYKVRRGYGDAYWSLANLKTYRFSDDEVRDMVAHEAAGSTAGADRIALCFALGKAFEDRGEDGPSFGYYHRGNALKRAESPFTMDRIASELDHQQQHFDADFFHARKGWGYDARDPIFIVGLPRAGSTLLEQILASHSQIDGTMELGALLGIAQRFNARQNRGDVPNYPRQLADLPAETLQKLGEEYIAETRRHRATAPFFIDKMPNNFRHIALIHLILPNAKIIDARRDPLACCFSCYKQLFAEGQEFTYDLASLGEYYRRYHQVMAHWDRVLPGRVHRVQHERLLDNLEGEVRRILEYCELEFEHGCIEFHKTERAVKTPSSEQVRQPITRSGTKVWTRYEAHLEPLKAELGETILAEFGL